jgi:hypothetical protein
MEDIFAPIGSACFGIIVGFAFRYFLERFESYDVKKLATLLAVPLAPTLLLFLGNFGPNFRPAYTLGMVLGLVLYQGFYSKFPALKLPFRRGKTGLLTRTNVKDVVTILDNTGNRATWVRTQTMKFHRDGNEVLISKDWRLGENCAEQLNQHWTRRRYAGAQGICLRPVPSRGPQRRVGGHQVRKHN